MKYGTLVSHCCVASDNPSSRRMLATSFKLAQVASYVESYDLHALWRRLVAPAEPQAQLCVLFMDGEFSTQMLDRIRSTAELELLPVIIVTPEATADHVLQIMERDADDYLITPLVPIEVAQRVSRLIQRRAHPSEFERALLNGRKALRANQIQEATRHFEDALVAKPHSTSASYFLGLTSELNGNVELAEHYYRSAVKYRMNLRAKYRLAHLYHQQKRYDDMRPLVDQLVRYLSVPVPWLSVCAGLDVQAGEYSEAAKRIRQAHRAWCADVSYTEYPPLSVLRDAVQGEQRNTEIVSAALTIVTDFDRVRTHIERLDYHERVALAAVALKIGRPSEARTFLLKAMDVAPTPKAKVFIHEQLAEVYKEAGVDRLAREHKRLLSEQTQQSGDAANAGL